MGYGKLVFTTLLAVFLAQQYSSAYPIEGQNANATGENQVINTESSAKVIHQLRQRIPQHMAQYERTLAPDCVEPAANLLGQIFNIVPQSSQAITNVISITNDLMNCLQAGFSTTTSRCLQNLGNRIQDIVNNTFQQDRQLVINYANTFGRLVNCISNPLPN